MIKVIQDRRNAIVRERQGISEPISHVPPPQLLNFTMAVRPRGE
jgi:hypothetical protein